MTGHDLAFAFMLPPAPDRCQECATEHGPDEPHNRDSLYYQMQFHLRHGRWPTWADAMAHCSREVQEETRRILQRHGAWDPSQEGGDC